MALFAFGVGLANFAPGRDVLPRDMAAAVAGELPLVAWYGSTGNFAFHDGDVDEIQAVLGRLTRTAWAVVTADQLDDGLRALSELPPPYHAVDERPTPGLAFAVNPPVGGTLTSTPRAVLEHVSDTVVAAVKLDLLRDGKLARHQRRGGCGGVSADIPQPPNP